MALELTFHGTRPREGGSSANVDALTKQIGDAIAVADGAVSAALPGTGLYKLSVTSNCRFRVDADPADATGGELGFTGDHDVRYFVQGDKIAVDAA